MIDDAADLCDLIAEIKVLEQACEDLAVTNTSENGSIELKRLDSVE